MASTSAGAIAMAMSVWAAASSTLCPTPAGQGADHQREQRTEQEKDEIAAEQDRHEIAPRDDPCGLPSDRRRLGRGFAAHRRLRRAVSPRAPWPPPRRRWRRRRRAARPARSTARGCRRRPRSGRAAAARCRFGQREVPERRPRARVGRQGRAPRAVGMRASPAGPAGGCGRGRRRPCPRTAPCRRR